MFFVYSFGGVIVSRGVLWGFEDVLGKVKLVFSLYMSGFLCFLRV